MKTRLSTIFVAGALALTTFTVAPAPARAQGTEDLARRLVGEGIEAARSRDWLTARDRFERAYAIQPLPLTLYNLAAAQEKTGAFVEADRSYRIFLRETEDGEVDEFRKIASDRRKAVRSKICYVVISAPNLESDDVLTVANREVAHAVLGEPLPANPGTLIVRVDRAGQAIVSERISLNEGATQNVQLSVPKYQPPVAAQRPAAAQNQASNNAAGSGTTGATTTSPAAGSGTAGSEPGSEAESGDSILASPVLWGAVAGVVIGVVVLAAAGAAGGVYAYITPGPPSDSTIEPTGIAGE